MVTDSDRRVAVVSGEHPGQTTGAIRVSPEGGGQARWGVSGSDPELQCSADRAIVGTTPTLYIPAHGSMWLRGGDDWIRSRGQ